MQGDHVHYGQVIQLLSCSSDSFVTVKKNVAKIEGQCLKVDMSESGDEGSWFLVEPAFKFRSVGNKIAYGDSVRLVSVKFKQYLHISGSRMPIQTQYFDGVHEVNASTIPATFEVMPYASVTEDDSNKVVCGRVLSIKHSEMNGCLMYDPAIPDRGPFWSVEEEEGADSGKAAEEWKVSNALWSLEAQTVEWAGGPLQATLGTAPTDLSKEKGYRLEHVNTGLYLTLAPAPKEAGGGGGARLTMTDAFTSDRTLWYFRFKNEGGDDEEGQHAAVNYSSVTPVYLQHSSGVWLSRMTSEGDDAAAAKGSVAAAASNAARQPATWDGGAQLACRKELNFTDSITVLDIDQCAMREIAKLLKLMKSIEFFLGEARTKSGAFDVPNTDTPELQEALEAVDKAERERGLPGPLQFMSTINPVPNMSNLNPLRAFEDENPNKVSESVSATVALLRKNVAAGVPGARKQRAHFFTCILASRIRTLLARRKADGGHLRNKRAELVESLTRIRDWLAPDPAAPPRPWHQNTLREQGALRVLDVLLRSLVDAGFVLVDGAAHSGSIRETSSLLASLHFTEIGTLLFDILRLACAGNPANAASLQRSIPVYDLYLGTSFDSAGLLHEIFKDRRITSAFSKDDILRYAVLMSQHRRPVFVRLIRNLLACDGRPIPANQRLVAGQLFSSLTTALPEMRVVPTEDGLPECCNLKLRRFKHLSNAKVPDVKPSAVVEEEWIDLQAFINSYASICTKPEGGLSDEEMQVVYFGEVLELLRDLCQKRCSEAIALVSKNSRMQLDYISVLNVMRSERVPFEIRGRFCELMQTLYVDAEPQKLRSLIPRVRLIRPSAASRSSGIKVGNQSQIDGRQSIDFNRLELVKQSVIHYIEAFATAPADSHLGLRMGLLKHFCDLTLFLLRFGLFLSTDSASLTSNDLHRLIYAVLHNIDCNHLSSEFSTSIKESSSPSDEVGKFSDTEAHEMTKEPDTEEVVQCSEPDPETSKIRGAVLGLMGNILELAFDMRSASRTELLVRMYERHCGLVGKTGDIAESLFVEFLEEMKGPMSCPDLGKCSGEEIATSIFRLSKVQANPRLQSLALMLLLRQLAPIKEAMDISRSLLLVEDEQSASCYNQLRESVTILRNCFDDSKNGPIHLETVTILSEHLEIVSQLLNQDKYGTYLVKEIQKYLSAEKFHLLVREILKFPLDLKHSDKGLETAENPVILDLFIHCYTVLQGFCLGNEQNQEEIFPLTTLMLEHVSVDKLNATECVIGCLRGNAALCSRVPEKILRHFLMTIVRYGKQARWLKVLLVSMTGDGKPVEHSQEIVLRNLEEMAELILELDGHQGDGQGPDMDQGKADADPKKVSGQEGDGKKPDSDKVSSREKTVSSQPSTVGSEEAIKPQINGANAPPTLKRKETSRLLAREGMATRQELMMQGDHESENSFLEYHTLCLETLAKCAEGLNQTRKAKCQTFLSFDEVLESVLDLDLSPRPETVTKISPDVLRYIRTGDFIFPKKCAPRSPRMTRSLPNTILLQDSSNFLGKCMYPLRIRKRYRYFSGMTIGGTRTKKNHQLRNGEIRLA